MPTLVSYNAILDSMDDVELIQYRKEIVERINIVTTELETKPSIYNDMCLMLYVRKNTSKPKTPNDYWAFLEKLLIKLNDFLTHMNVYIETDINI